MSIQSEINRLTQNISAAFTAVGNKGGTVPSSKTSGNLATAINSIPEATDPVLQSKTVTPSTSKQTVTPDSGYDGLSSVTVNAMTTATQATPSISVNTSGLITASATQTAGYVTAGTKSATKQLTTQAAQTITPGTSDKTIASGRYLTGTQTVKGDSNLVAENIKSGVEIFGVTGTHKGGTTVQTKTGTFTSGTSSKPKVTVNCGFKPDTVRLIIPGENYDVYPYEVTIDFNTSASGSNCFALWSYDDTYFMWSVIFEQTSTGFTVDAYAWYGDWNSAYVGKTFQYTAKKYTE